MNKVVAVAYELPSEDVASKVGDVLKEIGYDFRPYLINGKAEVPAGSVRPKDVAILMILILSSYEITYSHINGLAYHVLDAARARKTGNVLILNNTGISLRKSLDLYDVRDISGLDKFSFREAILSVLSGKIESERAADIPAQGAGPHFALSDSGKLQLVEAGSFDEAGNDIARINMLLPVVRRSVEDAFNNVVGSGNEFPELFRDVVDYRSCVSMAPHQLQWGLLWGLGVRIDNAVFAAERKQVGLLAPPLEDAALAALQSLRMLHGPLILATRIGRELQEHADRLVMTPAEMESFRTAAVQLARSIKKEGDLADPVVEKIIVAASQEIGTGVHPERASTFGLVTIKHISIVIINAAIAAVPLHYIGGMTGAVLTMGTWEALKKSNIFNAAIAGLGVSTDFVVKNMSNLQRLRQFVLYVEPSLRKISVSNQQLRWIGPWLDYIKQPNLADDQEKRR